MRLQSHSTGRAVPSFAVAAPGHDGRNDIQPGVSSFVRLQDNLAMVQAERRCAGRCQA